MANFIFDKFKLYVGDGTIDLDNDAFKCALLTDSHVPSAGYEAFAEISSAEVSGSVYTAGGVVLTGVTWTESGGTGTFDANNPTWTDSSFTARYAVVYDDTTTSPADALMFFYDLDANNLVNNGTIRLIVNASGLARIL